MLRLLLLEQGPSSVGLLPSALQPVPLRASQVNAQGRFHWQLGRCRQPPSEPFLLYAWGLLLRNGVLSAEQHT